CILSAPRSDALHSLSLHDALPIFFTRLYRPRRLQLPSPKHDSVWITPLSVSSSLGLSGFCIHSESRTVHEGRGSSRLTYSAISIAQIPVPVPKSSILSGCEFGTIGAQWS